MNVIYRINDKVTPKQVSEVFHHSGIRRPIDDLERIQRMIDHADEIVTAWDDTQLVGILRAMTDYSYCCYISDIAVDCRYQKQGIGKKLVLLLQEKLGNEEIQYVLTSAPKSVQFYEKIGFAKAEKAFVIARSRHV